MIILVSLAERLKLFFNDYLLVLKEHPFLGTGVGFLGLILVGLFVYSLIKIKTASRSDGANYLKTNAKTSWP